MLEAREPAPEGDRPPSESPAAAKPLDAAIISTATDEAEHLRDTRIVYGFLSDRLRQLRRPGITAWAAQLDAADLADLDRTIRDRTIRKLKRLRRALAARFEQP